MKLDPSTIAALAERLENCELQAQDTTKITDDYPDMDWDDAYAIQDEVRRRKVARGSRIVGLKAGLTSHAKMKQMGVSTPVFGFMADYYAVPDGGECRMSELIHPKVEPEIAFVTKAELRGPGCHIGSVLAATDFVMPGIEVIDSR
jgi:2-oxo-3-hexenedioate decarboxylase